MVVRIAREPASGAVAGLHGMEHIRTGIARRSAMVHAVIAHARAQAIVIACIAADRTYIVGAPPNAGGVAVGRIGTIEAGVGAAIGIAVTGAGSALRMITGVADKRAAVGGTVPTTGGDPVLRRGAGVAIGATVADVAVGHTDASAVVIA